MTFTIATKDGKVLYQSPTVDSYAVALGYYLDKAPRDGVDGSIDLRCVDFRGANLRGVWFRRGSDITGADFTGADLAGARFLSPAGLSTAIGIVALGAPDGWADAFAYHGPGGHVYVRVGCRSFTLSRGLRYWRGKKGRREVYAAMKYADAVARARGWLKTPKARPKPAKKKRPTRKATPKKKATPRRAAKR